MFDFFKKRFAFRVFGVLLQSQSFKSLLFHGTIFAYIGKREVALFLAGELTAGVDLLTVTEVFDDLIVAVHARFCIDVG